MGLRARGGREGDDYRKSRDRGERCISGDASRPALNHSRTRLLGEIIRHGYPRQGSEPCRPRVDRLEGGWYAGPLLACTLHMTRPVTPWKEYGRYGSVGIELVVSIMLGYYAGHWLDGKIGGGRGWLTAFGSLLGVYAGFRAIFSAAKHMEADILRAERRERGEDPWAPIVPPGTPPSPPDPNAPTSTSNGKHK
jgi:hypothetical protein